MALILQLCEAAEKTDRCVASLSSVTATAMSFCSTSVAPVTRSVPLNHLIKKDEETEGGG